MKTQRKTRTYFLVWVVVSSLLTSDALSTRALAQSWTWSNLTPADGPAPEPRHRGTAIFDPVGNQIIVFGGIGANGLLNDLWAFDLSALAWSRLDATGTMPAPRFGHNAVYDSAGHQMVLWAGQGETQFFNDTWTLDLTTIAWSDVSPATRPEARYGSASIFDPDRDRVVQFAGFTDLSRRFQDTQAFNLQTNTWEDLSPPGDTPEIRCLLTAALDQNMRRMIIYGGQHNGPLDDLWAFGLDAPAWSQFTPDPRPAGRFFATSFVDLDGNFFVFGGATSSGNVNETWAFNFATGQWNLLDIANPPPERNAMMGAYIEGENRFVVFGGIGGDFYNDIWVLSK
jgi:hypothetical protein